MGCTDSKVSNSDVLWRCKKRKRMMGDAVKFRQEFAAAQLAYIGTLKDVGHRLSQYANRHLGNMEVIHAEKKGEAAGDPLPPSTQSSSAPVTKPTPSASLSPGKKSNPPSPAASRPPSPQQAPSHSSSDANHAHSSKGKDTPIPNGVSSPTIESLRHQRSNDVLVSSMPSSPLSATAYYPLSEPSSPLNSTWDPFSFFSVLPFRSPERLLRQLQDWDPDPETSTYAGADALPDLEEADTGREVELNEPNNLSSEQNHGNVKTMQSLGKPEKKPKEADAEKMLSTIYEDSAEEAASPTKDTITAVDAKANGKETDRVHGVKDAASFIKQIDECTKRIIDAFETASQSGNEVSQMLEAQIVYPRTRLRDFSDSFRLSGTFSWQRSWKSTSNWVDLDESDDDLGHDEFGSHSLTLERLYTWEKKLYKEVKVGEKLRVAFLRKSREFHSIDGKRKDPDLIEQCRADMKSLESQLVVAFRAISSVSLRIQQVTYEELYPQLGELLRRLKIMWKAMLECHTAQKEAAQEILIMEKAGDVKFAASESHSCAATELENQLEAWRQHFCLWVISQQRYIDTLFKWIKVCHMEPEPNGRRGAATPAWTTEKTPIYMLARSWHDSLQCLEGNTEVVDAIGKFAGAVHDAQVSEWEEFVRTRRAELASRSMDYRGRKVDVRSGEHDKRIEGEDAVLASLKVHLPSIFGALTTFAMDAFREYEKLHEEADSDEVK